MDARRNLIEDLLAATYKCLADLEEGQENICPQHDKACKKDSLTVYKNLLRNWEFLAERKTMNDLVSVEDLYQKVLDMAPRYDHSLGEVVEGSLCINPIARSSDGEDQENKGLPYENYVEDNQFRRDKAKASRRT